MSKYYPATMHNLARALADVNYPITKDELMAGVGDRMVQINYDCSVALNDILCKLLLNRFTCAAELFNNIICVIW